MRIVLDTNVLIAAFVSHGTCHEIFEHIIRNHTLVLSDFILGEFQRTLINKFGFDIDSVNKASDLLKVGSELVSPIRFNEQICSDPDDDQVLGTAISGNCICILSGDKHLTELKKIHGITILKPIDFWQFES